MLDCLHPRLAGSQEAPNLEGLWNFVQPFQLKFVVVTRGVDDIVQQEMLRRMARDPSEKGRDRAGWGSP